MRSAERNQADALRRIRDYGSMAWCKGKGRAGGAVSRLFDRMTKEGLCTKAPHEITDAGRAWLNAFDVRNPARCLHCRKVQAVHLSGRQHCPIGRKHRTLGYTQHASTQWFATR